MSGALYYSASPCFPIDTVFYIEPEAASRHLFQALHSLNFISSDSAVPGLNRTYARTSYRCLHRAMRSPKHLRATVGPLFEQVENLTRQNQQFARARDLLLPKLMSGQLDVSGIRLPGGGGMNARTKDAACPSAGSTRTSHSNKTRQGYARKRILKPAGYFFVRPERAGDAT